MTSHDDDNLEAFLEEPTSQILLTTIIIFLLKSGKEQVITTYLYFRSSQRLDHETIILRQKKDTATFPWRRQFPQSIISTNGHHIVSSINLEQLSQISAMGLKKVISNKQLKIERKIKRGKKK